MIDLCSPLDGHVEDFRARYAGLVKGATTPNVSLCGESECFWHDQLPTFVLSGLRCSAAKVCEGCKLKEVRHKWQFGRGSDVAGGARQQLKWLPAANYM